jgi:hypothetical protein
VTFGSTTTEMTVATMRINGDAIVGGSQSEPEKEESEDESDGSELEDDSTSTIARRCPMINFGAF